MITSATPSERAFRRPQEVLANDNPERLEQIALSALDGLRKGVAVFGDDCRVLYCNIRFRELFASDKEHTVLLQYLTEEDRSDSTDQTVEWAGRILRVRSVAVNSGLLFTADDISESAIEYARAAELARTDPLTQLGNRRMFRESVAKAAHGLNPARPPAILLIDLDRFKAVNDALGHAVGDALLRVISQRILSCLGGSDLSARLGGDEFVILQLDQPQPAAASALATRLVDLLGRSYLVEGNVVNVGASVGIALVTSADARYEDLLTNADLAMYRAKQEGRGSFRFFDPAMREAIEKRRELEVELRRALAMREFELHYQPQLNLRSQRVTGFEALLRWNHPKRGLIPPASFIPLAEELGLILPIGEWALRTACRQAADWPDALNVAVNVSALQIESGSLIAIVVSSLAESGIPPHRLELEITESVLLQDHQRTLQTLHTIRGLGVRISMDDFGTGYSSLSYLRSFPFDKIKIDQSFIRGENADRDDMPIVKAIAALGHALGMTITAEGAENRDQFAKLAATGCTDVQGYAISRPMPSDQIAAFLAKEHR